MPRLLQSGQNLRPLRNYIQYSCWNTSSKNEFLLSTKARDSQLHVTKRRLGWLLATTLKPGQKGYERQRKMQNRALVASWFFGFGIIYVLYKLGIIPAFIAGFSFSREHFFDIGRQKAAEIKEKREAQDQEMLRLAEVRKKNAEMFPAEKQNESDSYK